MGKVIPFYDTLKSFVSRLGTDRDKAATVFYDTPQWTDEQLANAYRGTWLARQIVDVPAFDAFRKWRSWQAKADQIAKLEAEEVRHGLRRKLLDAKVEARLFGGAALYIGIDNQDPATPLESDKVGSQGLSYVTSLTKRDLSPGEIEKDPASEWFGKPAWYDLSAGNRMGVRIHPSRLVILTGADVPNLMNTSGWGDSVLVSTMSAIKHADSTAANIASLVFEAKVDVIRVPELMQSLADPEYETRLLNRFGLASMAKGINGALLLDKDEEFNAKTISLAGLPDVMMVFMQLVSGAADIPATRFLGRSPAGLNASGESDLKNYHDRIQSIQELEIAPAMSRLDECLIRSALGTHPPEVHFTWNPLTQLSEAEMAEIGKIDAEIIEKLNSTGLYPPEALAKAGANMLVEHSIMPGLLEAIDAAGGLQDYEDVLDHDEHDHDEQGTRR